MLAVWLGVLVLAVCFGGVLLVGAPYVPTLTPQVRAALDLLDLPAGKTVLELGCGDGKVLVAAAEAGLQAVGYELNPLLAAVAWLRTRRYRGQVRVVCANFWQASWPDAAGIFVFLHPRFMRRLDKKIVQYNKYEVKLVSFAFAVPDKVPTAQRRGVYLYHYDAAER